MNGACAPLVQSYHPTTFAERGVAVPFTTPMLAAARVRPSERGSPELIVQNPAGGRGVYILAWSNVDQLCCPTVHDAKLYEAVSSHRAVTPSSIRLAARRIAGDGLAGRAAAAAAETAAQSETARLVHINFLLLLELVRQVEAPNEYPVPPERERPSMLEKRAQRVFARLVPTTGQSVDSLARGLEELASVFVEIGIGAQARVARIAVLVEELHRLHAAMVQWASTHDDESGAIADMVAKIAALSITCTTTTLADARALIVDLPALLARWLHAHEPLARRIARPEWLLDGWEQICLIWRTALGARERYAALQEIAPMVPFIPKEAGEWVGCELEFDTIPRYGRTVQRFEDWRTGTSYLDMIGRNEQLRALAL
jgi:hypothetical protein